VRELKLELDLEAVWESRQQEILQVEGRLVDEQDHHLM
jgi:hypothetical protein